MRFLVTFILVFGFSELQINASGLGNDFNDWSSPQLHAFGGSRASASSGGTAHCNKLGAGSNHNKSCKDDSEKIVTYGSYVKASKSDGGTELEAATGDLGSRCDSAYRKTKVACNGIIFSGQVIPMLQQFQAAQSSGNLKEMCEKAAKVNTLTSGLNLAFAVSCQRAQSACVSACNRAEESEATYSGKGPDYSEKRDYCEGQQMVSMLGYLQTAQSATQAIGSKTCADMASGKCVGNDSFDDEDCVQFCQKPGRQTHPKCAIAMNSCNDATFASQNAQLCECLSNPMATNCGFTMPVVDLDNSGNYNDPFANLDLPNPYEYGGNNPTGNRSGVEGGGGGGGGFGGGGGGSAPFGQNDGNYGGGDEELNKDILGGQSSGSGMPIGGGGGGYENNGSGGSGRARGSSGGDGLGFDLRAFLPGGKKDPKRGIASNGYADQSITEANGLTNFQKITRKLNQKKVELTP